MEDLPNNSDDQTKQGEDLPPFDGDAYCVKCKTKQPLISAAVVKAPNGTYLAKGVSPESGTKINRIIGRTWPKPA